MLVAAGCKPNDLSGVTNQLRFDPASVTFELVYADGLTRSKEVTVVNDVRATLDFSRKLNK